MKKKGSWKFFIIALIFISLSVNLTGVTVAQETHDVAVLSIIMSAPPEAGELVNVTVVVRNEGTVNETFEVKVYYDQASPAWLIESYNVTALDAGINQSLTFTWNTTDVIAGKHSLVAVASEVSGETDTTDNVLISTIRIGVSTSPYLAVIPHSTSDTTLTVGENFTVSIYTDYNGSDIWGYEFRLEYNPNVLKGVEVTNGDLISAAKNPGATFLEGTFDNVAGELSLTGAFFDYSTPPAPLTSGPGTLANVTFRVVAIGDSDIEIVEHPSYPSRLIGFTEDGNGIEYNIIDDFTPDLGHLLTGYFGAPEIHDVAVLSVTLSNTTIQVSDLVDITVVVSNEGTVTETFIVKVYQNQIGDNFIIETRNITALAAGANTSFTITWDTTDVSGGIHRVIARAIPVFNEENTANNVVNSQYVTISFLPETPIPVELILIVLGIIAAIIIVIFIYRRLRKQKSK